MRGDSADSATEPVASNADSSAVRSLADERAAYLRGEHDARARLGGNALVDYLCECAVLRIEPAPAKIVALVNNHQLGSGDEGPNCMCRSAFERTGAHVGGCPLAQDLR